MVLAARSTDLLEQLAREIEAAGGKALAVTCDVGDADSQRRLVEQTLATFGRLDFAFNNATDGPPPGPLHEIDPEAFDLGAAWARSMKWRA